MAAEKTDVNVLEPKLGRSVVLKQLDSSSVPVKCDSDYSEINKSGTSEVRNVLVELNCKNASLCKIESPKNEQRWLEETRKCIDNNATTCSSLQSLDFKQTPSTEIDHLPHGTEVPFLASEVLINKDAHLSKQAINIFETSKSPNKTVKDTKCLELQHCRKRSVSELHKEDLIANYSSVKKKTKLSDGIFVNASVTQVGDVADYQKLSPKIFEINPVHSSLMLKQSDEQLYDKLRKGFEHDFGSLISSSKAFVNEERNSISFKLCTQTLPQIVEKNVAQREEAPLNEGEQSKVNVSKDRNTCKNYIVLKELDSHSHFDLMDKESVQTADSSALSKDQPRNSVEFKDSCVLTDVSVMSEEKLVVQPVMDAEKSVCISSLVTDKHDFREVFSNDATEEDLDANISEVADTVVRFLVKPQSEAVCGEDKPMGFSQLEGLMNIQSDVASFEEKSTERSQPEVIDLPLVARDKRDFVHCRFIDEQVNEIPCIGEEAIEEMKAMFRNDSEMYNFEYEDTINPFSEVAQISDILYETEVGENVNRYIIEQHIPACLEFCFDDWNFGTLQGIKQCCNAEGIFSVTAKSDVLVIPETELFDFASYNETEVDDVAQNVCIGAADCKLEGQIMNCNKPSVKPSF